MVASYTLSGCTNRTVLGYRQPPPPRSSCMIPRFISFSPITPHSNASPPPTSSQLVPVAPRTSSAPIAPNARKREKTHLARLGLQQSQLRRIVSTHVGMLERAPSVAVGGFESLTEIPLRFVLSSGGEAFEGVCGEGGVSEERESKGREETHRGEAGEGKR